MNAGAPTRHSTVGAMKAGAIEFLTKPVDLGVLLAAIRLALARDRKQRQRNAELAELQERLSQLTPREREVLPLVVGGLLNKEAASILGQSHAEDRLYPSRLLLASRGGVCLLWRDDDCTFQAAPSPLRCRP